MMSANTHRLHWLHRTSAAEKTARGYEGVARTPNAYALLAGIPSTISKLKAKPRVQRTAAASSTPTAAGYALAHPLASAGYPLAPQPCRRHCSSLRLHGLRAVGPSRYHVEQLSCLERAQAGQAGLSKRCWLCGQRGGLDPSPSQSQVEASSPRPLRRARRRANCRLGGPGPIQSARSTSLMQSGLTRTYWIWSGCARFCPIWAQAIIDM